MKRIPTTILVQLAIFFLFNFVFPPYIASHHEPKDNSIYISWNTFCGPVGKNGVPGGVSWDINLFAVSFK